MKKKLVLVDVIAILAVILISGCTTQSPNNDNINGNTNLNPSPNQTETEVQIPLDNISTTVTFYALDSDGVSIRYFAAKDTQGNAHVAMDACDVCYEAKKGYKQDGDDMQCINCGKTFSITSIGTENSAGGCWPSFLPFTIQENNIVIKITDLESKKYMFE